MPDLITILITVNVLLSIGPFLHPGVGGATFITAPAELKGKPCSGSAEELLKDAPCLGAHHFTGYQRKSEAIVKAMNIGSAPYFLADFVAIGRSHTPLKHE